MFLLCSSGRKLPKIVDDDEVSFMTLSTVPIHIIHVLIVSLSGLIFSCKSKISNSIVGKKISYWGAK